MSEDAHATAVKAALTAANAAPKDLDEIAAANKQPDFYTEVGVVRRYGGTLHNDTTSGTQAWRITTRAVSKYVTNTRELNDRIRTALEYTVLTIGGVETTPIQFESGEEPGEDDAWWTALSTWTYTI